MREKEDEADSEEDEAQQLVPRELQPHHSLCKVCVCGVLCVLGVCVCVCVQSEEDKAEQRDLQPHHSLEYKSSLKIVYVYI